jgi:hypothetical protein
LSAEHRRPVTQPSRAFDWVIGSDDAGSALKLANETAWALLHRVRDGADPEVVDRVVHLAAESGIDDVAELWSNASPHTLAGQLWRIYLLQRIVATNPEETAHFFRQGMEAAPTIHPLVAGVADPIAPNSIAELCRTILRGVFAGDLAVALERASSYCRVMSLGTAAVADDRDNFHDEQATMLTTRSLRYSALADELHAGARRWQDGTLG